MTQFEHRDKCAIVGIGATDFSRRSGRSVLTLASEACIAAIQDAGLAPKDIDGIVRCDYDVANHHSLAHALGLRNVTYWGSTGIGGAAPSGMIAQAVGAICSGQARNVVAYRSLNGRSGMRFGQGRAPSAGGERVGGESSYDEFFMPYGMLSPGHMWALIAQRHMIQYGTSPEHLGSIATAARARANANPSAQMHDRTMTIDDYFASPMMSAPLRMFDYCLETDGACAVVVSSAEQAHDAPQPAVLIRAITQAVGSDVQPGISNATVLRKDALDLPSRHAAATLYERAGMKPADVDVAQFYDCFTIAVLMQLEDYGFCKRGEGGAYVASGAINPGGALPVNTAGGNLSEGYIHGMNHVLEGVRQLRGQSNSQVEDAAVCLVTSGVPIATGAMLLRRSGT